jgi:hypothetical protein
MGHPSFVRAREPQGLKPVVFSIVYGPTKQAAEKSAPGGKATPQGLQAVPAPPLRTPRTTSWGIFSRPCGTEFVSGVLTQTLKPVVSQSFTARLKSCPDTKHEFFRSLWSPYPLKTRVFRSLKPCSLSAGFSAAFLTTGRVPTFLTSLRFHFLRYLNVPTRCANSNHNKKVKKQCQQSTSL